MFRRKEMPSVAVDFDNTIATWKGFSDTGKALVGEPVKGVQEALRALKKLGFYIVIWTSRMSKELRDSPSDREAQWKFVKSYLERYDIPWDEIDRGDLGKRPFDFYIDDRNVPFGDWTMMSRWVVMKWSSEGSAYFPNASQNSLEAPEKTQIEDEVF